MQKISMDTIISLVIMFVCFFAGYQVSNWIKESDALEQERQERQIEVERNKAADEVATRVLDGLSQWKKNTETVVKEMHFEKTKPEFYNVCFTDGYVSLFNTKQQQSRSAITNEPKGAVQK